jgi:hypothetical protein
VLRKAETAPMLTGEQSFRTTLANPRDRRRSRISIQMLSRSGFVPWASCGMPG